MRLNWKVKVLIQFTLSKLPGGESINHRLQGMYGRYTPAQMRARILGRLPKFQELMRYVPLRDSTIVEIGTGWELLAPLLMYIFGSSRIYTYDHVRHLRFHVPQMIIREMQGLTDLLVSAGADRKRIEALQQVADLPELLRLCNIEYFAPGDGSATSLPDKSVDLFFTDAVLEHVKPQVLSALVAESHRILKPSGAGFHIIGTGDHYHELGVSLVNFLQYSDRVWNFWIQNKISYHNRLRGKEFIEAFEQEGFKIRNLLTKAEQSDIELLRSGKLKVDKRFSGFTPEELAVHHMEVVYSF